MKPIIIALSFLMVLGFLFSCKKTDSLSQTSVQNQNPTPTPTDSFTVTVNNGYGSGKYKTGDTVHIFSAHFSSSQIFDKWSGDTTLLNASHEYHTWFLMPGKNVSFTGSVKSINPFTLQFQQIQGRDRLKPVYYYFPSGHTGFVYLLHGSNGSASNLVNDFEWQQLIKDLINQNLGIIVTEAEEATTGIDINGDGALRWVLSPLDSTTNVDYANIKIITNTLYSKGLTNSSKTKYSIGMSDGGFFSAALSSFFNFKDGVNYCSQGSVTTIQSTKTPVQFCMARNDNNSNVGPAGNATALNNNSALLARGVCSKYYIKERCPLYTERFARRGDISTTQSVAVYNELKSKGYIDSKSFCTGTSSTALATAYSNSPTSFPMFNSLTAAQQSFVEDQIDLCISDHHMYSDYDRASLKFLLNPCY